MKLFLLCLLAGMGLSTAVLSPPLLSVENEFTEIAAIRLPESIAQSYWEKHEVSHFTVGEDAVLRPSKGYSLGINLDERVYVVTPTDWSFQPPAGDPESYAQEPIPGGTMHCMCTGGNDNCEITVTIENNKVRYFCGGSCNCFSFSESDPIKIDVNLQTLEGEWGSY